jgi:hypothetical protein
MKTQDKFFVHNKLNSSKLQDNVVSYMDVVKGD